MLISLLLSAALAGPIFSSTGEELSLGEGGNWVRLHPTEEGWWFFQSAGRDYWASALDADLAGYDSQSRVQLTDHGDLQDIQIERCEDGGWLVAGSYSLDEADDSARAWTLDADLGFVASTLIAEREGEIPHNDLVPLCGGGWEGVLTQDSRESSASTFYELTGGTVSLDMEGMGGSLAIRPSDGRLIGVDVQGPQSATLRISEFGEDGAVLQRHSVPVPQGEAFWPQRLLPLDEGWVLVYLARDGEGGGTEGEVWLMALDADFQMVDSLKVSPEGTSTNGRPWVSRREGVLAVSYDRDVQPRVVLVPLTADAVPEDDGIVDPVEDGDDDGDGRGDGCGCATGVGAGWLVGLVLPVVLRRRGRGVSS